MLSHLKKTFYVSLIFSLCACTQLQTQKSLNTKNTDSSPQTAEDPNKSWRPSMETPFPPIVINTILNDEQKAELKAKGGKGSYHFTDEQKQKALELGYVLTNEGDEPDHGEPAGLLKTGTQAPDFTLKDINGKTHKLSDYRGKYVLIDFWGTWCPPCVKALPKIAKAYKQVDKSKIEFIGISVGSNNLSEFVKKNKLNWVQLEDTDHDNGPNVTYNVTAYPTMYLIGPDGKVVTTSKENNYALESDLLGTLNKYLK